MRGLPSFGKEGNNGRGSLTCGFSPLPLSWAFACYNPEQLGNSFKEKMRR